MGYLGTEDTSSYLSKALLIHSGHSAENRKSCSQQSFRLAVEISMMMHLLATTLNITDEELHRLRGRCVAEVKRPEVKSVWTMRWSFRAALRLKNNGSHYSQVSLS